MLPHLLPFFLGGASYAPNFVQFDGSNDYLTRGAGLTGLSDGKQLTISFWYYDLNKNNDNQKLISTQSGGFQMLFDDVNGRHNLIAGSAFNVSTPDDTDNFDANRHHIIISVDVTSTSKRWVYIDGVDASPNWNSYNNTNIDLTETNWSIGADPNSINKLQAAIADLWMDDSYIDISNSDNLNKFIKDGNPVDLGASGENPTGSSPILFHTGDASAFPTNAGTGGGMTENGSLTDYTP